MKPRTRAVLILAAAPVVIVFALSLLAVALPSAPLQHLDQSFPLFLRRFATPTLTRILLAFTWLGAIRTIVPAVALAVAWLLVHGRRRPALQLTLALPGALLLNASLKLIFHRPRPGLPWSFAGLAAPPEHTFSYPSGHAFFATALYGMLAYIALHEPARSARRLGIIALAILMPLAIGLSRIYFGMHNPTDVLAGYLAGTLWLFAIVSATQTAKAYWHEYRKGE